MSRGVSSRPAETLLTERAVTFLGPGPAEAVPLIEYVCQMPGAPRVVAEQMALALFAGRPEFARERDGRWTLAPQDELQEVPQPVPMADRAPRAAAKATVATPEYMPLRRGDRLDALSYVVVDTETTGTSPWRGDRVTEVAAMVVCDGRIVRRFETLVNPQRPIPPMITALTHISWDMVKDAPTFGDICEPLLEVLEGHVFVGHNADFDWRFLGSEVARATGRRLLGRRLCTVRLARRLLPQLRSRRLDSVAYYYGVDITARHRAGGDAEATAHVLLRLLADARSHDCHHWDDLQRLLGIRGRRPRRRRPPAMPRPVDKDTTA